MSGFTERLARVQERIERGCALAGRDPGEVTLVAVSKTVGVDAIREAYDCGIRTFGEARVQEAEAKIEALPEDIEWHLIGTLQSNKAKKAALLFDVIHSIESEAQIREIEKSGRGPEVFLQVNMTREAQKSGVFAEGVDKLLARVLSSPRVRCTGLMMIGSVDASENETRAYFAALRELAGVHGLSKLSMGMSDDLELALQEGATHVRIGTSLFGARG